MACACNSKKPATNATWVHTAPDGTKTSYATEVEAAGAKVRKGGSYKKV